MHKLSRDRLNLINKINTVYGRNIRNMSADEVKEGCRMSSHMSEVSSHLYIFVLWLTGLDE